MGRGGRKNPPNALTSRRDESDTDSAKVDRGPLRRASVSAETPQAETGLIPMAPAPDARRICLGERRRTHPDARAASAVGSSGGAGRGRSLPRLRRTTRPGAMHGRLPGRRRRARLHRCDRRGDEPAPRERSSPRTCSAHVRAGLPGRSAVRGRLRPAREGRRPIGIGALQRYATDSAFAANGASCGAAPTERAAGRRHRRRPCRARVRRRAGRARLRVTVYDEREEIGGLVRYAIAPYRQQREPLPAEAAALGGSASSFASAPHRRSELRGIVDEADAVFWASAWARTSQIPYPGDDLPGVWESLPFIER